MKSSNLITDSSELLSLATHIEPWLISKQMSDTKIETIWLALEKAGAIAMISIWLQPIKLKDQAKQIAVQNLKMESLDFSDSANSTLSDKLVILLQGELVEYCEQDGTFLTTNQNMSILGSSNKKKISQLDPTSSQWSSLLLANWNNACKQQKAVFGAKKASSRFSFPKRNDNRQKVTHSIYQSDTLAPKQECGNENPNRNQPRTSFRRNSRKLIVSKLKLQYIRDPENASSGESVTLENGKPVRKSMAPVRVLFPGDLAIVPCEIDKQGGNVSSSKFICSKDSKMLTISKADIEAQIKGLEEQQLVQQQSFLSEALSIGTQHLPLTLVKMLFESAQVR